MCKRKITPSSRVFQKSTSIEFIIIEHKKRRDKCIVKNSSVANQTIDCSDIAFTKEEIKLLKKSK